MAVVATTFVTDARSKTVPDETSGEFASYVNRPAEPETSMSSPCVTANAAPGKTRSAIPCWRINVACSRMRAADAVVFKDAVGET